MATICHVCDKPIDEPYAVTCMSCGREIHFPADDAAENNCGYIVTQLQACALAFLCKHCSRQRARGDLETRF